MVRCTAHHSHPTRWEVPADVTTLWLSLLQPPAPAATFSSAALAAAAAGAAAQLLLPPELCTALKQAPLSFKGRHR